MIDIKNLKIAIDKRHHATERFFDIDYAKVDRDENLEMLQRIEQGVASREDIENAHSLINGYIV